MKIFNPERIFVLLFSLIVSAISAQNVGINTTGATPNAAAILDLNTGNAGTMGFLPEQVALIANNFAIPVILPPTGLIVYNTATSGPVPNNVIPGYYYWDGAQWQLMLTGSGSTTLAWTLKGNTGITASTSPINALANNNFIGTTTGADFVLAANGFERMRIANGTGNIGVSNIAPTTLLQVGNAATTTGKFSVFSQDAGFGQVQIGNPNANSEASMQFISGVTAFGNPPTSSGGNVNLWNIGAGSYGVGGSKFNIADFAFGPVMTFTSAGLVGINTINPQQNLSVNAGENIDQSAGNSGFINNGLPTGNGLTFGPTSGEGIADNRNSQAGFEQYGLQFYTSYMLAMNISSFTFGTQPGQVSITNGLNVDQAGTNNGFLDNNLPTGNSLTFGINSGEGIASKRTVGGDQFGLDFYTGFAERMTIRQTGQIGIGTLVPAQQLEVAWTTSTIRIDGIKAGNTYYSSVTPATAAASVLFANNTTGDIQALAPSATNGQVLTQTATGPAWQSMGSVNNVQVITTSGTYTPSAGTTSILVKFVGGGGGGGGVAATNHVGNADALAAGGGGAGGYCEYFISGVAASYPVTVGGGGAGGAPGNNAGGSGGATTFNGVTANGGSGGNGSGAFAGSFFNPGGAGGTTVGGTVNIPGNPGANGVIIVNSPASATIAGAGGSTPLGSGGIAPYVINNVTAGINATGYGSGGSGADSNWQSAGDNGPGSGGAGAPGVIIIYEYK